jgi:hypothetical protein
MKKIILNIFACLTLIFGVKRLTNSKEINVGYWAASTLTKNGIIQNGAASAGGAAGWLGAQALGRFIGGAAGSIVGGPFGIIIGAGIGAA